MLLETFIAQASLMMIIFYDHHIFIVQATGVKAHLSIGR
jgi:hypothetical protein